MQETDFLSQFVGRSELRGATVRVSLKGPHALQVAPPGQPAYELEPIKGTTFRLKRLSGFRLKFDRDAPGEVTEAELTQPGGVFTINKLA